MRIGIMGAMAEEVSRLLPYLSEATSETLGMREYVSGQLLGKPVTLVFSRWGKVAAASGPTESPSRVGWCSHAGAGFVGTAPVRWPTPLPLLI